MPRFLLTLYARRSLAGAMLLLLIALALTVFGLLAEDIVEGEAIGFDHPIQAWLHAHGSPALDAVMKAITFLGSVWMVAPLTLAVLWRLRRSPPRACYWALANVGSMCINLLAKHGFQRARPGDWPQLVQAHSYSFPSGHAMQTMALCTAVLMLWPDRRWRLAACAAYVAAVGVSRMYLGVHYPSDILAGWCAAVAWCVGLSFLLPPRGGAAR